MKEVSLMDFVVLVYIVFRDGCVNRYVDRFFI